MAEYIEREALLQTIDETVLFTVRESTRLPTPEMRGANKVIDCIKSAPTVDVVEVVRCKDCKYYNPNYRRFESDIPYNRCEHPAQQFNVECYDMWLETNPDDFCSYGERKEGKE